MSNGATAKCMCLNVDRVFATAKFQYLYQRTTFFWLRFLDRWVDWCWTGLQRNVHVFHVGCVFATAKLFFCAQFLERWVEWCWMGLQRSGEFDINQVLSYCWARFIDRWPQRSWSIFFLPLRSLEQPRAVLVENEELLWFMSHCIFEPFSNLSYGFEDIHQARLTQESAWSAWAFDGFPRPSALVLRSWYFVRFTSNSVALSPPTIWNTVLSSGAAFLPPQGDLAALCKVFSVCQKVSILESKPEVSFHPRDSTHGRLGCQHTCARELPKRSSKSVLKSARELPKRSSKRAFNIARKNSKA